jgi:hypothetical protein
MSSEQPTKPYVYQPFGVSNPKRTAEGRLYGVGGLETISPYIEGTLKGLTKDEAAQIVRILTPEQPTPEREGKQK